ncbi:SDR family NAD(P)-dependent oxidoreductase, partial [Streptomyces scabiei]|uniref:SDR family NAD(P)-dependent oxidoreductase n=1 Tax=Streptomyces scabiei TaxID=1930 RepID=UPI0039EE0AD3
MGQLEGRTAVVTGGGTGIGLASAVRLADEGAHVFITGRRKATLDAAVETIGAERVTAVAGDVSDAADVDRLYDAVRARGRGLDVVFANAATASLVPLEEITEEDRGVYEKELAGAYPYHTVQGTVGLWSRLPLSDPRPVDIATDYGPLADTKPADVQLAGNRALRTTVATDRGPLVVYVAHLGSVRLTPRDGFWTDSRDRNAQALGEVLAADRSERMMLLGDLNGTLDDRALAGITARLHSAQDAAGDGFGFSWPAKFPVAR